MKNIMILLLLIGLISCNVQHPTKFNIYKLNGDYSDIFVKNDTFYYKQEPIAVYSNTELECIGENCMVEISVTQFSNGFNDKTDRLMRFLYNQHPNSKIEIKVK